MDSNVSSTLALISIVSSVGGTIIALINHKRIRSKCCGRTVEASVDIENTTPPRDEFHYTRKPAEKPAVEV